MQNKKILALIIAIFVFGAMYVGLTSNSVQALDVQYPLSTLTGANDFAFLLQTQAIKFEGGKWTYHFTWNRTRNAPGTIVIAPKVNESVRVAELDPAPRANAANAPLVVQLDPATRYVFRYYSVPGCDQASLTTDPECVAIRSIYFNTRNESGKIMDTSEVPLSQGGTKVDTLANTGVTSIIANLGPDSSVASLQTMVNQLIQLVQTLLAQIQGGGVTPTIVSTTGTIPVTGTTGTIGVSTTATMATCQADLSRYKKFEPLQGVSPTITINSQLAQEMKNWPRCHYHGTYGQQGDAGGKSFFTATLEEQRQEAQRCIDLFNQQATMLGFDQHSCSMGEYCGVNDYSPDGLCPSNISPNDYRGREILCTLGKGTAKTGGFQANQVVGNDYGKGTANAEPQSWLDSVGTINTMIAQQSLAQQFLTSNAYYDIGKKVFRPHYDPKQYPISAPTSCNKVFNVNLTSATATGGTVTWQVPSGVQRVNIYLIDQLKYPYTVSTRIDEFGLAMTIAESVPNNGSYTFKIPNPDLQFGSIGGTLSDISGISGYGLPYSGYVVRVVADNGAFGDSPNAVFNNNPEHINLGVNDYGTRSNPPPIYAPTTCTLPANIDVGNANRCDTITTNSFNVGLYASGYSHGGWYPGIWSDARMVLRVAPDNGGKGEVAVRGGCANLADCLLKRDDIWNDPRYLQGDPTIAPPNAGFQVNNLMPNTKYWFRTAAICGYGQANQTYKEEVWSCTTKPATTDVQGGRACANECNPGQSHCSLLALNNKTRLLCGNYDSDSCYEYSGTGVAGSYQKDDSCLAYVQPCGGEGQGVCPLNEYARECPADVKLGNVGGICRPVCGGTGQVMCSSGGSSVYCNAGLTADSSTGLCR